MRRPTASLLVLIASVLIVSGCTSAETKRERHFARGNEYFDKGDYPDAMVEYRTAVQADARSGKARARLSLTYEKLGDLVQAFREAVRAADLMPSDMDAQIRAGQLLMAASLFEDAAARAEKVLERDPADLRALMLLGHASARLNDSDKALATLEAAVKQLPGAARLQQSLGSLHSGRGDREAAESAFKRAIAIAPESPEPREALANYYWSVGRAADAERVLLEALALDPAATTVGRALAVFYFLEGRDREAEPLLVRLVQQLPEDASLRLALGDLYLRQNRLEEALKAYEPLQGDEGASTTAAVRMAYVEHTANRKDAAYRRLAAAQARAPREPEPPTMTAVLALADKRFKDAETASRSALELAPDRFEALYVLGSALLAGGPDDRAEARGALEQAARLLPRAVGPKVQLARLHFERGDAETALQFAREALAIDPDQPQARLIVVRALVARREVREAGRMVRPLVEKLPDSSQAHAAAGDVALLEGGRATAREAYQRALQLNPKSLEALNGLIVMEMAAGRSSAALALAKQAVAASPSNPSILILAAQTHIAAKDEPAAEALLQQAISIAPAASFRAYGILAGLYFRQNRLDQAKTQFEAMTQQQASAPGPLTMIGIILQLQGKPAEAQAIYERVLQTTPDAALAANNLAMLLVESGGNLDVALNLAQTAKKAQPGDPEVNDTLGLVYFKKGLASLAVTSFEVSTGARPDKPEFWLHLGQAHAAAGDKVKARAALQKALELNPTFDGAEEARRALEGLDRRA